jgi:multidrug efflux pump subunit AcrA (membrane-fusion protein)
LQIKAQIEAARVKMLTDSVNYSRYEKLYATNSVSKQDLDNARLNFISDASSFKALQESYRSSTEKVKQEFANTQAQLQNAQAGNQYFDLNAIGRGKVYQIFKKQGDLIRKGEQVAQLGNPDSIIINLNIDEATIGKVKEGQKALIELNTEKNKTYEARITKIYPHFNDAAQSYRIEARFVTDMPGLISGTQLQANIITNQKDKAMLINRAYVLSDNKVLRKKDGKTDTVLVTTGITSYDWVEITSGLTTSDVIIKQK